MKKTRLAAAAVVIASSSLFTGVALAGGRHAPPVANPAQTAGLVKACVAMHNSPAMDQMHIHMPAAMQAACDAMMQADMSGMMSNTAGMGHGSSATPAPPTSSGTIDPHHGAAGMMTGAMG